MSDALDGLIGAATTMVVAGGTMMIAKKMFEGVSDSMNPGKTYKKSSKRKTTRKTSRKTGSVGFGNFSNLGF